MSMRLSRGFWLLLVFVLIFILGIWNVNKKSNCFLTDKQLSYLGNTITDCGYLITDTSGVSSVYFGNIKNLFHKKGKVLLKLDFGKSNENVVLGNYGEKDFVLITLVNELGEPTSSREIIYLNDDGIKKIKNYLGNNAIFFSLMGSSESVNLFRERMLDMTIEERRNVNKLLDYLDKCRWYEKDVREYYSSNGKDFFDFSKLYLDKLSDCRIFGNNIYVYQ